MSLTFYSLFEVHACISIICFHYPGYPVERSFFFRHFALVYIEIKLLFVLSEFPARMMEGLNFDDLSFTMQLLEWSCHAFPGAMHPGVKSTSRHQALNLRISLSWFAWKEGFCNLYILLFKGDLAFGIIEIFANTPLNFLNQFLVLLLMSYSHTFSPHSKSIQRTFERHFETSSSHWLWWRYRGSRYIATLLYSMTVVEPNGFDCLRSWFGWMMWNDSINIRLGKTAVVEVVLCRRMDKSI